MKTSIRHFKLAFALAIFNLAAMPAAAAPAGFTNKPFVYRADDKKLSDVLQDFAASQGMPVVVDAGVTGSVNASINSQPEEFLKAMSRTYGVIWYFDGTTLFVYPARSMQSKVFRMRGYSRGQVREMLDSLGLGDPRFPLRFDDTTQTLMAYGPPRHIELVSTVLEQLERAGRDRVGGAIRIVRLQHATAADRVFGETRIPGLAKTLNDLFRGKASGDEADTALGVNIPDANRMARRLKSLQSNYGVPPSPAGTGPAGSITGARTGSDAANVLHSSQPVELFDADVPFFQPEAGTNSIIIRGLPDKMKEYEALVRQLDVVQDLVEIEATIIDINTSDFNSLGFDWTYTSNGVRRLTASTGSPGAQGGIGTEVFNTANITTLIGGASRQVLARIRALVGEGRAHIVSQPRVVGAANRMATMNNKETASVRVAGNLDTSLFQVETGTKLQIVPQIMSFDGERDVRLTLSIKDGKFENYTVDDVPLIKETQIDTDATLSEGESLLIGGIAVDSDVDGYTGIPGLAKIPVLGSLFKHRERSRTFQQRMFLITPKIIDVGPNKRSRRAAAEAGSKGPISGAQRKGPLSEQPVAVWCLANELGRSPNCPVQGY